MMPMGGGVQDIIDDYAIRALSQVEQALDDEIQRTDNLNVRQKLWAPGHRTGQAVARVSIAPIITLD